MRFERTQLQTAWLIQPEPVEDNRGFFARAWCQEEFLAHEIDLMPRQCNISFNKTAGTLRGMHWQAEPKSDAKLVRCTSGVIFDVIVDLRPDSASFACWQGFELSAQNRHMLYVPPGFAHGFVTVQDDSEVFYQMFESYAPELSRGLHWADETIGIDWPYPVTVVSDRDDELPRFTQLFPTAVSNSGAD